MASKEQLSSILDYVLSIEDEEVRRKRMIRIEPHILINLAQSVIIMAFHSYLSIIILSL